MNYRIAGFIFLMVMAVWLHGCSKGVALNESSLLTFILRNKTVDPINCQFVLDGNTQTSYLSNGGVVRQTAFLDNGDTVMNVKVVQLPLQNMLANVNYVPRLGKRDSICLTLFQPVSGATPYLVLPSDTATLPATGHAKLQFIYTNSSMPDSIKLKFYFLGDTSPRDSVVVKRNEYSNWANLLITTSGALQYEAYNAATNVLTSSKRNYPIVKTGIAYDFNIHHIDKDSYNNLVFTRLY